MSHVKRHACEYHASGLDESGESPYRLTPNADLHRPHDNVGIAGSTWRHVASGREGWQTAQRGRDLLVFPPPRLILAAMVERKL